MRGEPFLGIVCLQRWGLAWGFVWDALMLLMSMHCIALGVRRSNGQRRLHRRDGDGRALYICCESEPLWIMGEVIGGGRTGEAVDA